MKTLLGVLLFCTLLPAASAQSDFFTNILRGVTGVVGNKNPAPVTPTASLGVRGVDDGEVKVAVPVAEDVKQLESWAVGRKEAEAAAGRRGLTARIVDYETGTATPANSGGTPDPK